MSPRTRERCWKFDFIIANDLRPLASFSFCLVLVDEGFDRMARSAHFGEVMFLATKARRLGGMLSLAILAATAIGCGDDSSSGNNTGPGETVAICGNGVVEFGEDCDDGDGNSDADADACRTTCVEPSCGDGVVDDGEGCDDGEGNSDTTAGACRTSCVAASCGDGVVDDGEACDDGDANSDTVADACRTTCEAASCGDDVIDAGEECDEGASNADETGATCRTSCVAATCGDGIVDTGEACDDGDANSDTAADACRTTCELATCGDGVIDAGESCDEGSENGDQTGATCRSNCALATCGDGVIDAGEECDNGDQNSDTAPNACRTTCVVAGCGDGILDANEACDDGDQNSDTDANACRTTCQAADCGDGVVDDGETCDDGDQNSDTASDACRTTCVPAGCGDGVIDSGEGCDNATQNSDTIADACRTTCQPADCGDGVIDNGEACDNGGANSDTAADACRTTCEVASCGDGVVDNGESCDAGASNSDTAADACRTTCVPAECGDGVVDSNEECDAGAQNSDTASDACRTTCVAADCGDGVTDSDEDCDDGAANSDTAVDACRTSCIAAGCGDGVIDTGDVCDDDNLIGGDGCSAACDSDETCGNGVVDPGETCDDGNRENGDGCQANCDGYGYCDSGRILLFDGFGNGDVATGGTSDVNGGFNTVKNCGSTCTNQTFTESGGILTIATPTPGTGAEPNVGIVSANALDLADDTGATFVWEVTAADTPRWEGITMAAQSGTAQYESGGARPVLYLQVKNTGSVQLKARNGNGTRTYLTKSYDNAALADGFTATLRVDYLGWEVTIAGLYTDGSGFHESGTWATGWEYADLFDSTMYVSANIQGDNSDTTPRELSLDYIGVYANGPAYVFDDSFDNNDLATGGANAINGGFLINRNCSDCPDVDAFESGGTVVMQTSALNPGAEPQVGIISNSAIDLAGAPARSFRWEVTSADVPRWNGITLVLQNNNTSYFSAGAQRPTLELKVRGDNGSPNDTVQLLVRSSSTVTYATEPFDRAELDDGFTAWLTVDDMGWWFSIEGLKTDGSVVGSSGTWNTGFGAADIFDSTMYIAAYIQGDNSDSVPRYLEVDRISVCEP